MPENEVFNRGDMLRWARFVTNGEVDGQQLESKFREWLRGPSDAEAKQTVAQLVLSKVQEVMSDLSQWSCEGSLCHADAADFFEKLSAAAERQSGVCWEMQNAETMAEAEGT